MGKHTPGQFKSRDFDKDDWLSGPTTASLNGPCCDHERAFKIVSCNHQTVAIFPLPENGSGEEMQANADLFAAAPMMLQALEEIEKTLHDTQHYPWEIVRRAIAAAKGDSDAR